MLTAVRKVLGYQMTIAEWIGTGLLLAAPYLVIGIVWSATHTEHLSTMSGADRAVSFLGSIVSWPVLLISDVCMT